MATRQGGTDDGDQQEENLSHRIDVTAGAHAAEGTRRYRTGGISESDLCQGFRGDAQGACAGSRRGARCHPVRRAGTGGQRQTTRSLLPAEWPQPFAPAIAARLRSRKARAMACPPWRAGEQRAPGRCSRRFRLGSPSLHAFAGSDAVSPKAIREPGHGARPKGFQGGSGSALAPWFSTWVRRRSIGHRTHAVDTPPHRPYSGR